MKPNREQAPQELPACKSFQERKLYLDVLRILAAFLVCYNHTFAFELYLGQIPDGSLIFWVNVATSVLTTIGVPLFLMISGALILGKKESYKVIFFKRIWRFLVLLVCASGITYLFIGERPLSAAVFVKNLISGDIHLTYWYLYAYLSLLLAKPLLQKFAELMTGSDLFFLLALRVVFFSGKMILHSCSSIFGLAQVSFSGDFQLPFISFDFLFFPLAGYYLGTKLPVEKIRVQEVLGCIAAILLGTGITSGLIYAEGYFLEFTQNYITLFTYFNAIAVFVLIRYAMSKVTIPHRVNKYIVCISNVAIGIYLLEPIVGHFLFDPFHRGMPWTQTAVMGRSLLWCLFCMILCGGLTHLLRFIPGVKKYL